MSLGHLCQKAFYFCAVEADLNVFAYDLHYLQVELLDRGSRKVNMTQQAVDDLQQGLLRAWKALLQQLAIQHSG